MNKLLFVDRIENGRIICENESGEEVVISDKKLVSAAAEGSVIELDSSGRLLISQELTQERKQKIIDLRDEIYN